MSHDAVLEFIIRESKKSGGINKAWLFGSRAKGSFHEKSDYDLAFAWDINSPSSWGDFCQNLQEKNPVLNTLDIVRLDQVGDSLRQRILEEGTLLYDKSSAKL